MGYVDSFKRMNSIYGTTNKEYYINIGKDGFEQYIKEIPNSIDFTINEDTIEYMGALQTLSKNGIKGDGKLLLVSLENPLKVGDYVYFKNSSDFVNQTWLVTGQENEVLHSHRKFVIKPTNHTFNFVHNGNVYKVPAIMTNALLYTLGTETDKYTMYGNSKLSILVGRNATTELINEDMRIICDRLVWRISSVNGISVDGVPILGMLSLMAGQDVFNEETDDKENGVADRWSSANPKPEYTFNYPVEISLNVNNILSTTSGLFKVYNNGILVSSPNLSIVTDSPLFTRIGSDYKANSLGETDVIIKFIGLDKEYTQSVHIKIIASVPITSTTYSVNYSGTVLPSAIKTYQTCNLYVIKKENGNIVNNANYIITYDGAGSDSITFRVTDMNKCSITNNSGVNQTVNVYFRNTVDNVVTRYIVNLVK